MKKITFILFLSLSLMGFSQEILIDGDFESGAATPNWTGNGGGATVIDDGSGTNFVNSALVGAAAESWQTSLQQVVALTQDGSYDLSFDAYVDAGTATMITGIGQNGGSFLNTQEIPTLTTTPTTFSYTLVANWDTVGAGSRVFFDMGGTANDGITIFIDNVSLVQSVLSTDEFQITKPKVFPNPTLDSWNIESANSNIDKFEVYDVLGKRVQSLSPDRQKATIDGTNLKAGLYLAKLYLGDTVSTIRLIKN